MPVDIDTTEAPALLRITFTGALPTPEEQQAMRERLIADGLLTADSACLIDVRAAEVPDAITIGKSIAAAVRAGIPRRRACVINPGKHLAV
ncbi:MAG TPA: hypothetical protein VEA16_01805, partial [Vicinamibacterales bacterium]|nr:hypothetical protein [Vicinamibacterales bacterium]